MEVETKRKISSFTDLEAWKESHRLALLIYEITKGFPKEEIFGLTNQLRRAAVSIVSNIAEGFSRITPKEKAHFYTMALGSLYEVQSQTLLARDTGHIGIDSFSRIADQSVKASKIINGLIKSTRSRSLTPAS